MRSSHASSRPKTSTPRSKFKRLIRGAAKRGDVFDGASEIYMDSCIELRSGYQSGGLMTYITSPARERSIGGISASLPGLPLAVAVAYRLGPACGRRRPPSRGPIEPVSPTSW